MPGGVPQPGARYLPQQGGGLPNGSPMPHLQGAAGVPSQLPPNQRNMLLNNPPTMNTFPRPGVPNNMQSGMVPGQGLPPGPQNMNVRATSTGAAGVGTNMRPMAPNPQSSPGRNQPNNMMPNNVPQRMTSQPIGTPGTVTQAAYGAIGPGASLLSGTTPGQGGPQQQQQKRMFRIASPCSSPCV